MKPEIKLAFIVGAISLAAITFYVGLHIGMTSANNQIKAAFKEGYLIGMERLIDPLIDQSGGGKPQYIDIEVLSNGYLNAVKK